MGPSSRDPDRESSPSYKDYSPKSTGRRHGLESKTVLEEEVPVVSSGPSIAREFTGGLGVQEERTETLRYIGT